jgi:hypothetical protein
VADRHSKGREVTADGEVRIGRGVMKPPARATAGKRGSGRLRLHEVSEGSINRGQDGPQKGVVCHRAVDASRYLSRWRRGKKFIGYIVKKVTKKA